MGRTNTEIGLSFQAVTNLRRADLIKPVGNSNFFGSSLCNCAGKRTSKYLEEAQKALNDKNFFSVDSSDSSKTPNWIRDTLNSNNCLKLPRPLKSSSIKTFLKKFNWILNQKPNTTSELCGKPKGPYQAGGVAICDQKLFRTLN